MRSSASSRRPLLTLGARSLARLLPLALLVAVLAVLGISPAQALSASGNYRCKDYNVSTTLAMQGAPTTMYVNETANTTMTSKMVFPNGAERHLANQWRDFTVPDGQPLPGSTWPVRTTYVEGGASINGSFGATSPTLIASYPRENVKLLGNGFTWTEAAKAVQIKAPSTPGDIPVKFGAFTLNLPLGGSLFFKDVPLGVEQWNCVAPAGGLTVATVRVRSRSHVSFTLDPASVQQGDRSTARAAVGVDGGTANGTVTFFDTDEPATALATAAVTNGTTSATQLSALPAGEYEIGARFTPSNPTYYDASTAADPQLLTVKAPLDTATSLTVDPLNILTTESTTATAEVTSAQGTPDGAIVFTVDGAALPEVPLVAGKASKSLSGLSKGQHPVVATFVPANPNRHQPSTSLTRTVEVTKLADASSTSVTFNTNPAWSTDLVEATATVSISGGAVPLGVINWTILGTDPDSTVFDEKTSQLTGSRATLDLSDLPSGHYDVTAEFAPTTASEQTVSADTRKLEVRTPPATTTGTTLSLSKTAATTGDTVEATATVAPASPRPQGAVVFTVNGVDRAAQTPTNGTATLTLPSLAAGSYAVAVRFVPEDPAIFTPSSAPTQTLTVTDAPAVVTTTTLTVTPGTIVEDESATVTTTVSAASGSPTGRINFTLTPAGGGSPLTFTRAYDGGASLVLDDLAPGTWSVRGTFVPGPDDNYTSSTSAPVALTVTPAPPAASTTTLSLSRTTALTTDPVTATTTVATGRGDAQGAVVFSWGATTVTVPLVDGTAATLLDGLPVGLTMIDARFEPAHPTRQSPSTATPRSVTVTQAPVGATVTTLSLSRSTAPANVDVVATAQVSSAAAEPAGAIVLEIDGTEVGRRPLTAGSASFILTGLAVGERTVVARFVPAVGSSTSASDSAPQVLTVVPSPGPAPTTALLSLSPSAVLIGETSTATVLVSTASGTPSGDVEFSFRGVTTMVPLASGQADLVLQAGSGPGTYEVSARFVSDDPAVADSAPSLDSLVVSSYRAALSSTSLKLSTARAMTTEEVVLHATVQSSADEVDGAVRFTYGTTSVIGPLDPDSGTAQATVSGMQAGDYSVTATYLPSDPVSVRGSTSDAASLTVNGASAVNLTLSSESVNQGAAVTATAAVTTVGGTDSGVVTVSVGGEEVSAPVADGSATMSLPTLAAGSYPVRASFAPTDTKVLGSDSTKRLLSVTPVARPFSARGATAPTAPPRATTLKVVTSASSLPFAKSGTVTATISGGAAGVVQFTVGAFSEDVVVSAGTASLALPRTLPVGIQTVNASFLPADPVLFAPSRATMALTVVKDRSRLRLGKRYFSDDKVLQVRGLILGRAGSLGQGSARFVLKRGKKKVRSLTREVDCNGFVVARFPIGKSGVYQVQIRYLGSDTLLPATAAMTKKIG